MPALVFFLRHFSSLLYSTESGIKTREFLLNPFMSRKSCHYPFRITLLFFMNFLATWVACPDLFPVQGLENMYILNFHAWGINQVICATHVEVNKEPYQGICFSSHSTSTETAKAMHSANWHQPDLLCCFQKAFALPLARPSSYGF